MPVVDASGRVVGVVGEADLLRWSVVPDPRASLIHLPSEPADPPRFVDEVMSRHPITVSEDADVTEAVELMISTVVKSLPVLGHGRILVGIISRRDLVHRLARSDDLIKATLEALLRELGVTWETSVDEGVATVTGPVGRRAHELARSAACTVEAVRSVHVYDEGEQSPRS